MKYTGKETMPQQRANPQLLERTTMHVSVGLYPSVIPRTERGIGFGLNRSSRARKTATGGK